MIKVRDWVASIPEEEKHIAYVGEGNSERREFLLCGDGWEAYKNHNFHLDMAFDLTGITTRDSRQVVQTTVNSTKSTEETRVNTEEVTTEETYTVDKTTVLDYDKTDIAPLSKTVEAEGIRLVWTVLRQHTQLPGKLWASIRAVSTDATQIKKSAIMVFEVDNSIQAVPAAVPPISEFEQMEAEMSTLYQQVNMAAAEALNHSETAVMAADIALRYMEAAQEANQSAVQAQTETAAHLQQTGNAASIAVERAQQADTAATTAQTAATEAEHAAANAVTTLTGIQSVKTAAEAAAVRAETAAQTCRLVKIADDGNGNVSITLAVPSEENTSTVAHTLSGEAVTVDTAGAVGLPLEIAADDTATTVYVGGNNLLPTEDGTVTVESTYKRAYFPMVMPAGIYRVAATVTSDVPDGDRVTIQFYNGTTYVSEGYSITANTGERAYTTVTAPKPFDNVALFSGHGAQASNGYGATYRELTVVCGSGNKPAYEPYRGQTHPLPAEGLTVTAVPTVVMADSGSVSVTYHTEMSASSDEPVIDGGALQSLTVNNRQYTLAEDTVTDGKKWTGKTWVCVGDSLTQKMSHSDKYYHEYVADETGISVVNLGVGGTGYKKREEENLAFYQRVDSVPAADVVTLFGSGNDVAAFSALAPDAEDFVAYLGNETDTGTDTLCGCINTTIDNLYAKHPTIRVGIVSPTPWRHNGPTFSCTMGAYTEKLHAICRRRGIPFLDLFHTSAFRNEDETFRSLVFTGDASGAATHPNAIGHGMIAPRFRAFLETLL